MEFHFLGTGAGVPSVERNVSALAIRFLQQRGQQWLFDCGEATQHQILHSPITLTKIERIFISHLHGDHIYGLPGLLGSRSFQGAESNLVIYGPRGLRAFVETTLAVSGTHLHYDVEIVEIEDDGCLLEIDGYTVETFLLDHGMESYAYKVTEPTKPGTLQAEKLRALGLEPGPLYQELKNGKTIVTKDGQHLDGSDFLGPPKTGRVIVIAGDTRPFAPLVSFAKHADLLIHEATFRSDKQIHARKFGHSTVSDAATLAKEAEVNQLILTHISSRYAGEEEEIEAEARSIFPQCLLASDRMIHKI